ncbi:alpha/beta fold hydrolase [Aquimarina addita]|uniref:Alpha/beta fold hydrolase n=1 Tax=Aquimarina addita TaxID=870485 RepID=A0ABP7XE70_9FLAO
MKCLNQLLFFCKITILLLSTFSFATCVSESPALNYKILKGEHHVNDQLLILLHGMNSNTDMWNDFVKYIPKKTLVIAIEAPFTSKKNAYRWYDIDVTKKPYLSDVVQMDESTRKIEYFITTIQSKHKISTEKIAIAGFSQGAILSLNLALTNPEVVNFIGIFSGMLPDTMDTRISDTCSKLSFFITHGTQDKGIDIRLAEKMQVFLKENDIKVHMRVKDTGHTITDNQFKEFIHWWETSTQR